MNWTIVFAVISYESFVAIFLVAVGGVVIIAITAVLLKTLKDYKYLYWLAIYSKTCTILLGASWTLLIFAIGLANNLNPNPSVLLSFLLSVWEVPLLITLVLLFFSTGFTFLLYKNSRVALSHNSANPGLRNVSIASLSLLAGVLSLLFFNLINSYSLTPSLPSSLPAIVQAADIGALRQLVLMMNPSWLPLTMKLLLVGPVAFSILFSAASALRRMRTKGNEMTHLDFGVSWNFKLAMVFGSALGIVGYWQSAVLHTQDPVLAEGLMTGEMTQSASANLAVSMTALWDVGIALAMSLGALAGVYYLSRGRGSIVRESGEQRALKMFLPLLLILLTIGTYGALSSGESYPQQFVLGIGVFVGGYLTFEAVRRYFLGKVRLYVPAIAFIASCYAFLLYQAPNTEWYDAAAFGGVSWPLIGFPLLALTVYYFGTRWRDVKYWIPVSTAVLTLLIITVKVADVALTRGGTIIAIDPSKVAAVKSWAFQTGSDLTFLNQQHLNPTDFELFIGLLISFFILLALLYWFANMASLKSVHTSEQKQEIRETRE